MKAALVCSISILAVCIVATSSVAQGYTGAELAQKAEPAQQVTRLQAEVDSLRALVAMLISKVAYTAATDSLLAIMAEDIAVLKAENQALRARGKSEPSQYASLEPEPLEELSQTKDNSLTIYGWVDASGSTDNVARQSTFGLNQVEADLEKPFGDHVTTRADVELNSDGANGFGLDLEQGFLTYTLEQKHHWAVTFGKFNAPIGYERPDPEDIYLYTQGLLVDYGRPQNITGVMVSSELSRFLNWRFYVVNGWDLNADNNKAKTLGGRLEISPHSAYRLGISAISGPELENNNSSRRSVVDADLRFQPDSSFTVALEASYGQESDLPETGATASWTGGMILCSSRILGPLSLTTRFDYFNDKDGFRTGLPQELKALAISPRVTVAEGLDLFGEVRYDWSNQMSFTSDDVTYRSNRCSTAFQVLYCF